MLNGKIVTSVSSNNLTVAIKTLNTDADPTSSNPVFVRVGDTVMSITSSLSLTLNAGTNFFNSGGSELAGKDIDYAVYIGRRTSGGAAFVGVSRIYHGVFYTDFSGNSTNEKFLAYTGSAPASTDRVEVVGRFNAILSSSPYNFSIPANSIVISRPIYETRKLVWSPVHTGFSTPPTVNAEYIIKGGQVFIWYYPSISGTSNGTDFYFTLPIGSSFSGIVNAISYASNNGTIVGCGINITGIYATLSNGSPYGGAWTPSGSKYAYVTVNYPI